MSTLAGIPNCCAPCADPATTEIPGPQGEQGDPGSNGTNGTNSFCSVISSFIMPASMGTVTVLVDGAEGLTANQPVFVTTAGTFLMVQDNSPFNSILLQNLGYPENVAPGTTITIGNKICPGGFRGTDGSSASGDMLGANNLSDVVSAPASRSNLGLGTMAVEVAANYCKKSDNLSGLGNTATARTNLGLAIGTNVQAHDADLDAIAGVVSAADRVPYFTGVATAAVAVFTSFARTLVACATAVAARAALGSVLPRYGVLAGLTGVNLNVATSDNAMTVESARYRIDKLVMENASTSVTTATAGLFTAAGGGGTTLAADQSLAALTASSKFMDLTLDAVCTTDVQTSGTVYFRVGTAQGGAATANVWLVGWKWD